MALEGILASWDAEMPHGWMTSRDCAAALQLKPTGWRIPNGSRLAVAKIRAPSRCMVWSGRYGQGLRNGSLEIVGPVERGLGHLRHQLVANATMDEAFLQAGAMGCSRGFGARGRLGLTAVLNSSRHSGGLNEVVGPVREPES